MRRCVKKGGSVKTKKGGRPDIRFVVAAKPRAKRRGGVTKGKVIRGLKKKQKKKIAVCVCVRVCVCVCVCV